MRTSSLLFGIALLLSCSPMQQGEPIPTTTLKRLEFSQIHPLFRFSVEIPESWNIEFIPEITAINVYNPQAAGVNALERSQIFIRLFEADRFLTLSSVNILSREETIVKGHSAVHYEIEKKPDIQDFPHQPLWRNARHRLTDVRFTKQNPSVFYVFAYNPSLPAEVFDRFLTSLTFHNDRESIIAPLTQLPERPILKPFGIKIAPEDSPIQPERFSGYHTGTDFEVLPEEGSADVTVSAICGGPVRLVKQSQGYGGVVVQECLLEENSVTVVYGHLTLGSVDLREDAFLSPGDPIGMLGEGGTEETDGERKHLHLGVHRGREIMLAGYVPNTSALSSWIDPLSIIHQFQSLTDTD